MHPSADLVGLAVAQQHVKESCVVVDVGGKSVNGSLRGHFETLGARYVSIDMEADASVDIVVQPGVPLPFENGSVDIIVSTSCFEHDPFFWLTFKDLCRIVKEGGIIYINAPQNGPCHRYPGDNWRFYTDAAQALAAWSQKPIFFERGDSASANVYPVVVEEQFFAGPYLSPPPCEWVDCCMIFRRVSDHLATTDIVLNRAAVFNGPVCTKVRGRGVPVTMQFVQSGDTSTTRPEPVNKGADDAGK